MAQGHQITITPTHMHIEVRLGGVKVAESDRPVVLHETGLPPRYYFPRDDVRMDLLKATSTETRCPFKGQASYWSADIDGQVHDDIVWSYEDPIPSALAIKGLLAFYNDRVDLKVGPSSRFTVEVDGHEAELVYERRGDRLILIHTGVPEALEGRGIGGQLVRAAIDDAVANNLIVVPLCPFAREWLRRHPDDAARVRIEWPD
jgi:uncharacterized protein (DUF427 family)